MQAAAASPVLSLSPSSPSFNSYSSANLADIAARVVEECRSESDSDIYGWEGDDFSCGERVERHNVIVEEDEEAEQEEEEEVVEEDEEFEFAFVSRKPDSPISADEIFFNGQIKPVYPLFDAALLSNDVPPANHQKPDDDNTKSSTKMRRLPLGKLMSEDRETTTTTSSSCSSSEADELDNLQPGTYCVWTPPKGSGPVSPGRCKKSSSTGSSKRWKFRDFLYRSNSDGKDTFVFMAPQHNHNKKEKVKVTAEEAEQQQQHHTIKDDDNKKRTYLPYRQDLVGLFNNNVNGLSRNLHPF